MPNATANITNKLHKMTIGNLYNVYMYRSGIDLFLSLSAMAIITKHWLQVWEIIIGIRRKSSSNESWLIEAEERKKLKVI